MFVMLLTSEFRHHVRAGAAVAAEDEGEDQVAMPVQYASSSVPSTVPSKPLALKTSAARASENDAARNTARNSHGA